MSIRHTSVFFYTNTNSYKNFGLLKNTCNVFKIDGLKTFHINLVCNKH